MLITRSFSAQILRFRSKLIRSYSSTVTELKEEKIKLDKWDINYMKVGTGPHKVLLMPGALGTMWTDFKPQIEGFDRKQFTVVAWDPPGYGKSRPPNKEFTPDFYERDAEHAYEFMKALNIPKYSVIGWSDGGTSSLILAAKHPDAIIKLVSFGTNSFILPHELEIYKKPKVENIVLPEGIRLCLLPMEESERYYGLLEQKGNKVKDVSSWSEKMKAPMVAAYGDFFPKYWASWIEGTEAVVKANDGNICAHLLKDIKCPTFILYGEKDPMVDPSHASHLLTHISDSRLHLYPDGKHNIHLRYASDFNKRVQEFLLRP